MIASEPGDGNQFRVRRFTLVRFTVVFRSLLDFFIAILLCIIYFHPLLLLLRGLQKPEFRFGLDWYRTMDNGRADDKSEMGRHGRMSSP